MDAEAEQAIASRLGPGEKIVWSGRPFPPAYAFYNGSGMRCFLLFCAVGLSLQLGSWLVFLASLLLFIAPVVSYKKGATVRYALTDKRAIMIATWPWAWERVIPVDRFNVCIRQGSPGDNRASIMFRKIDGQPWEIWRGTPFHADAFVGIEDSDTFEKLIAARVGEANVVNL